MYVVVYNSFHSNPRLGVLCKIGIVKRSYAKLQSWELCKIIISWIFFPGFFPGIFSLVPGIFPVNFSVTFRGFFPQNFPKISPKFPQNFPWFFQGFFRDFYRDFLSYPIVLSDWFIRLVFS